MMNIDFTKDYTAYSAEQLTQEPSFKAWALESDAAAYNFWEDWLMAHPEREQEAERARDILLADEEPLPASAAADEDAQWEAIARRSGLSHTLASQTPVRQLTPKTRWSWNMAAQVAAVVLLAIGIGTWLVRDVQQHTAQPELVYQTVVVPKGQQRQLTLSDGTRISLHAGAELSFPEHFGSDKREIFLKGQGFFQVAKDPSRPFSVVSQQVRTTALGTSFDVKASGGAIVVSLVEGKVAVTAPGVRTELIPGQQAAYDTTRRQLQKSALDEQTMAWRKGVLIFQEDTYADMIQKLEQWYGVRIMPAEQLPADRRFNARFQGQSLDEVLQAICYAEQLSYERKQDVIILKRR